MLSTCKKVFPIILVVIFIFGCAKERARPGKMFYKATGIASWYGKHLKGRATANGERFDPKAMTAAHRTLPFGTVAKVTNLSNGKSIVVRINDRGPASRRRLIDLTHVAAAELGYVSRGLTRVRVEAYRQ